MGSKFSNFRNNRNMENKVQRGWVLYDGQCALCTGLAHRLRPSLERHGLEVAPLQSSWVRERLGGSTDERLKEMLLLTSTGEVFGGADAFVELSSRIWWGW